MKLVLPIILAIPFCAMAEPITVEKVVLDTEVVNMVDGTYVGFLDVDVPGSNESFYVGPCTTQIQYKEVWGLEVDYSGFYPRIVKVPTDKTNVEYTFDCQGG